MAYNHYNDPYEQGTATWKHIFFTWKHIILYEYIKVINAIITGKEKQWFPYKSYFFLLAYPLVFSEFM